jgi:uncharacterized protein (TIGR03435 family)
VRHLRRLVRRRNTWGEYLNAAIGCTPVSEKTVTDQSGLEGSFDFEYRLGGDDKDNDADIPSFLLTSMKGIGLMLKSGHGPVETIVIDHAEKPSANQGSGLTSDPVRPLLLDHRPLGNYR